MTEQPRKFITDYFDIKPSSSTTNIILTWNYDNIVPTDDNYKKLANGSNQKERTLPYINKIYVQYKLDGTDSWLNFTTSFSNITSPITIGNNESYQEHNQITINKKADEPWSNFSARIYGVNDNVSDNSENSIVISNLDFQKGVVPPQPVPHDNETLYTNGSNYNFTQNFKVSNTEDLPVNNQSTAQINRYKTTYSVNESLRSTFYNEPEPEYTIESYFDGSNTYGANALIPINIGNTDNSLRTGTSYKYEVQFGNNVTKQDYTENLSVKSNPRETPKTSLPPMEKGFIDFSSNTKTTSIMGSGITTNAGVVTDAIYLITPSNKFEPTVTDEQTFEVSKPYSTEINATGAGINLDNKSELVTIGINIDGTHNTIDYNGFSIGPETNVTSIVPNGNLAKYFAAASNVDMYNRIPTQKGFRIRGGIQLKDISGSDIGGGAQSTPHTLQYTYVRKDEVSLSPSNVSGTDKLNIYIDNLTVDPIVANNGTADTAEVTSVMWCMGIPSVKEMTIKLNRTYSNINTANGFIPAGGMIGEITSIGNTNYAKETYNISNSEINVGQDFGTYDKSYIKDSVMYNTSRTSSNTTLTVTEKAYSLKSIGGSTSNSLKITNLKHYCDFASFNSSNSRLTFNNIYEIHDISKLSDLSTLEISHYATTPPQKTTVKDHTLLYIEGKFKTNGPNNKYPNVNTYVWDDVQSSEYSAGRKGATLDGVPTTDNSGYKWIVFNITGITNNNSENVTTYTDSGGSEYNYFNTYQYLKNTIGLSANTVSKIKDSSDNNAIGFIRQTVSSSVGIGNLSRQYNPTGLWYNQTVVNKSLETILSTTNNGCNFEQGENWGPLLDTINGDNSMDIFIGLKNNVSLS
jgi:hypothetical protein